MDIAIVSPWPPEPTGIADYAVDLALQLRSRGLNVTQIEKNADINTILGILAKQDIVIYQVGNHADHHGWMLPIMMEVPGVVHLHDMVLHHLVVGSLERAGSLTYQGYSKVLQGWYPFDAQLAAVVAFEQGVPIWGSANVAALPLFEPIVRLATGVMVHSAFAAKAIQARLPYVPVFVVPQAYTNSCERRQRRKLSTIAIMGGGEPNRRFDWIASALEAINEDLSYPLVLEITGQLNPSVKSDIDRLRKLDKVELKLSGRVDEKGFDAAFLRADLLLALRCPTMGETSAIVAKALQCGLPSIVSDHGWYSELPACVRKLPPDERTSRELAELLRNLLNEELVFSNWSDACHLASLTFESGAKRAADIYAQALAELKMTASLRSRLAVSLASMGVDSDGIFTEQLTGLDVHCGFPSLSNLNAVLVAASDELRKSNDKWDDEPVPASPLEDQDFACRIEFLDGKVGLRSEEWVDFSIKISNDSAVHYVSPRPSSTSNLGIFIGYFWEKLDVESGVTQDFPRTRLAERLEAGATAVQMIRIKTPRDAGQYRLVVDLVQEGVAWFRDRQGQPGILFVDIQ
jgi:glycosyltransferase involved in cell wall biosynthesis